MLKDFLDLVASCAADVGRTLGPDDDWAPIIVIDSGPSAEKPITICQLDMNLDSPADRDVLAEIIVPDVVQQVHGIRFALVLTAWMVILKPGQPRSAAEADLSKDPHRVEVLTIYGFDADERTFGRANITRHPDTWPTFGEWTWRNGIEGRFAGMWRALESARA